MMAKLKIPPPISNKEAARATSGASEGPPVGAKAVAVGPAVGMAVEVGIGLEVAVGVGLVVAVVVGIAVWVAVGVAVCETCPVAE